MTKEHLITTIACKRNINGMSCDEAAKSVVGYRTKTITELKEILHHINEEKKETKTENKEIDFTTYQSKVLQLARKHFGNFELDILLRTNTKFKPSFVTNICARGWKNEMDISTTSKAVVCEWRRYQ